jgi:hypothetical protein
MFNSFLSSVAILQRAGRRGRKLSRGKISRESPRTSWIFFFPAGRWESYFQQWSHAGKIISTRAPA